MVFGEFEANFTEVIEQEIGRPNKTHRAKSEFKIDFEKGAVWEKTEQREPNGKTTTVGQFNFIGIETNTLSAFGQAADGTGYVVRLLKKGDEWEIRSVRINAAIPVGQGIETVVQFTFRGIDEKAKK
jgi:hypothetical protein